MQADTWTTPFLGWIGTLVRMLLEWDFEGLGFRV